MSTVAFCTRCVLHAKGARNCHRVYRERKRVLLGRIKRRGVYGLIALMIESSLIETRRRSDVVAQCCGKAANGKFPRGLTGSRPRVPDTRKVGHNW